MVHTIAELAVLLSALVPLSAQTLTPTVDTHVHLDGVSVDQGTARHRGTIDDSESASRLVGEMDRLGIAIALVMPPPQNPDQRGGYDYRSLLPALERFPERLRLVAGGGTLNPLIHGTAPTQVTPDGRQRFERQAAELVAAGAVGFGEMASLHVCMNERHHYLAVPADHPLFLLLADLSARYRAPIDLHMEAVPKVMPTPSRLIAACSKNPATLPATVPALERLLAHDREAVVVWQHIGWDNTGFMTPVLMRELLGRHRNLHLALKIAGPEIELGEAMPNRVIDRAGRLVGEWRQLIADFPDRFVIGADEFIRVPGSRAKGPPSLSESWSILEQLSPELARAVGAENPARLYRLVPSTGTSRP